MTGHLDPETLSALLDGEAEDGAGHLRTCAECGEALAVLGRVRAAVAEVPPLPADLRRRSLEAALAAAAYEPAADEPGAVVVPVPIPHRSTRLTRWVAAGSIAAMVLVVAGTVANLNRDERGDQVTDALKQESQAGGSAARSASDDRDYSSPAAPAMTTEEDLGQVGDPEALAARLAVRLGRDTAQLRGRATDSAGSDASSGPPASTAAAPAPAEGHSALASSLCVAEGAATLADARPLYRATGTYEGRPVVVVAYSVAGRVMASVLDPPGPQDPPGCRLVYSVAVP